MVATVLKPRQSRFFQSFISPPSLLVLFTLLTLCSSEWSAQASGPGELTPVLALQASINEVLTCIVCACAPDAVILFGPASKGKIEPDPDLGFLILKETPDRARLKAEVFGSLCPRARQHDIIVATVADVHTQKDCSYSLIWCVLTDGRLVYQTQRLQAQMSSWLGENQTQKTQELSLVLPPTKDSGKHSLRVKVLPNAFASSVDLQEDLTQTIGYILSSSQPEKILLLGSLARGFWGPYSCLEIAVIGEQPRSSRGQEERLTALASRHEENVHMFTLSEEELRVLENSATSLLGIHARFSVLLWQQGDPYPETLPERPTPQRLGSAMPTRLARSHAALGPGVGILITCQPEPSKLSLTRRATL